MTTYFAIFSLPPHLTLDTPALEKSFYALSRRLHPDRFAANPAAEQEAALAESSRLNDAYRTLKDPIARTEYLLKLEGIELEEQSSAATAAARTSGTPKSRSSPKTSSKKPSNSTCSSKKSAPPKKWATTIPNSARPRQRQSRLRRQASRHRRRPRDPPHPVGRRLRRRRLRRQSRRPRRHGRPAQPPQLPPQPRPRRQRRPRTLIGCPQTVSLSRRGNRGPRRAVLCPMQ